MGKLRPSQGWGLADVLQQIRVRDRPRWGCQSRGLLGTLLANTGPSTVPVSPRAGSFRPAPPAPGGSDPPPPPRARSSGQETPWAGRQVPIAVSTSGAHARPFPALRVLPSIWEVRGCRAMLVPVASASQRRAWQGGAKRDSCAASVRRVTPAGGLAALGEARGGDAACSWAPGRPREGHRVTDPPRSATQPPAPAREGQWPECWALWRKRHVPERGRLAVLSKLPVRGVEGACLCPSAVAGTDADPCCDPRVPGGGVSAGQGTLRSECGCGPLHSEATKCPARSPAAARPARPLGAGIGPAEQGGRGSHLPGELGLARRASRAPPALAALPHREAIPERSGARAGEGRAAAAPSWQPRCQTRAGVTPRGVCCRSLPGEQLASVSVSG
ncbi:hypothetical protein AAY473_004587 [Plecturocebus cupreus]